MLLRGKAPAFRLCLYPSLLLLADMESALTAEPDHEERAAHLLGAARSVADRLGLAYPENAERLRASRLRTLLSTKMGSERPANAIAIGSAQDDEAALESALTLLSSSNPSV